MLYLYNNVYSPLILHFKCKKHNISIKKRKKVRQGIADNKNCRTFAPQSRNNAPNQGAEMVTQEKERSLKDLHRDRKECSTRE